MALCNPSSTPAGQHISLEKRAPGHEVTADDSTKF